MSNSDLFSYLRWSLPDSELSSNNNNLHNDNLVLIGESLECSADFLIVNSLSYLLKSNRKVIFIHSKNSLDHYTQLSRKIGIQLHNYASKDQFYSIPLFDKVRKTKNTDELKQQENETQNIEQFAQRLFHVNDSSNSKTSDNVEFHSIYSEITGYETDCSIIIDSVNSLSLLSKSANHSDFYHFLTYLVSYCSNNSLFLFYHNDIDSSVSQFIGTLVSEASLRVNLTPLKTGFSADIHGIMQIIRQDFQTGIDNYNHTLHYKLSETGVNLHPRGHAV